MSFKYIIFNQPFKAVSQYIGGDAKVGQKGILVSDTEKSLSNYKKNPAVTYYLQRTSYGTFPRVCRPV
jgi:hypothetical protein